MSRLTDEEILVELRDLKLRVAVLIGNVAERIAEEEAVVDRIMQAVRESEGIVAGMESLTHECAIPERFAKRCDACGE